MVERRDGIRLISSCTGEVVLSSKYSIRCVFRNHSKAGAEIEISAAAKLPEQFKIICFELKIDTQAKTIWRRGDLLGLKFV